MGAMGRDLVGGAVTARAVHVRGGPLVVQCTRQQAMREGFADPGRSVRRHDQRALREWLSQVVAYCICQLADGQVLPHYVVQQVVLQPVAGSRDEVSGGCHVLSPKSNGNVGGV